jgi:hypothetical protein
VTYDFVPAVYNPISGVGTLAFAAASQKPAVAVSGKFGAAARSTVASFAVGQPTAEQLKPAGKVTTDSTGQRIKVLPAGNQ